QAPSSSPGVGHVRNVCKSPGICCGIEVNQERGVGTRHERWIRPFERELDQIWTARRLVYRADVERLMTRVVAFLDYVDAFIEVGARTQDGLALRACRYRPAAEKVWIPKGSLLQSEIERRLLDRHENVLYES